MLAQTEPDQRSHTQSPVLVLNQNYEPINVCPIRRAIVLVICEKAEVIEAYGSPIFTSCYRYEAPSIIRLYQLVRRPRPRVKLTRREIFVRDRYTCQYCGSTHGDLTLDHVVPRSKGGAHTWENLVTACRTCNHRKGGKMVNDARMKLMQVPFEPRAGAYYSIERRLQSSTQDSWLKFLPGLEAASTLALSSSSD
jgi:5-methylcytosine-specific restriction endonuclease McrA